MTFNFTFTEQEINLIWNILNSCSISGKDAPILTNIFEKMQNSLREQAQAMNMKNHQPEAKPTAEEKESE